MIGHHCREIYGIQEAELMGEHLERMPARLASKTWSKAPWRKTSTPDGVDLRQDCCENVALPQRLNIRRVGHA